MALVTLSRLVDRNATQTLVKWRALCAAYADPTNTKPVDLETVREYAEHLDLDDAVGCFESDAASIERVARLQQGVALLEEGIAKDLQPFKTMEGLTAAITKARAELERLESVEGGINSQRITLGYERNAISHTKNDCPRIYGQ